ncbi:pyridoxamine 5'-phosphate oxidase family protein [Candidatus Bathyarchaeota archaeon]|nr:pyridoxamine 5'-phosphate oxidase family protein [Candidatus Bathyarchaeota archaeon]
MAIRIPNPMPQQELEEYLKAFLKQNNMCVLATSKGDVPRATPIEYRSKDLTLYLVAENGQKLKNIAYNPNVSIGIHLPYKGMETAKGVQISGKATVLSQGTVEFTEGLAVYNWEKTSKEMGLKSFPASLCLIRVDPTKIELTDASLKKKGYSPRQTLKLDK